MMTEVNWLQLIIPAFAAVTGYLVRYYLDRMKEAEERRFADKREHYRNLILCLKSLREGNTEHLELLWFEYSFMWLHAPDAVIHSANELLRELRNEKTPLKDIAPLIGNLLMLMRRDMGFKRSRLSSVDFEGRLDEFSNE